MGPTRKTRVLTFSMILSVCEESGRWKCGKCWVVDCVTDVMLHNCARCHQIVCFLNRL